jgi:hypothetical protein
MAYKVFIDREDLLPSGSPLLGGKKGEILRGKG